MKLGTLDHVNLRTAAVDRMVDWYCTVLGMENGARPPFPFPGAWLYAGGRPIVHLVGVETEPKSIEPKIEHFALSANGLKDFLDRLDRAGVPWRAARVPGIDVCQINVHDPDGNHIHIDFSPQEADALGL